MTPFPASNTVTADEARRAAGMMKSLNPDERKRAARILEQWQFQNGRHKRKKRPEELPNARAGMRELSMSR